MVVWPFLSMENEEVMTVTGTVGTVYCGDSGDSGDWYQHQPSSPGAVRTSWRPSHTITLAVLPFLSHWHLTLSHCVTQIISISSLTLERSYLILCRWLEFIT